jgi:uncharacterized protein YjiS (DUF1127 family)
MRASATAGAGQRAADELHAAGSDPVATGRRRWPALRSVSDLFQRLVRRVGRRRRPRLDGWMAMDPRLLADIGVSRTDLHAVLYAGAPIERLGARSARQSSGEVVFSRRRPAAQLRLLGTDDLDAAA